MGGVTAEEAAHAKSVMDERRSRHQGDNNAIFLWLLCLLFCPNRGFNIQEKKVLATPKFTLLLLYIYRGAFLGMFQFKISGLTSLLGRKILRPESCLFA